jgi:hypothetical protein
MHIIHIIHIIHITHTYIYIYVLYSDRPAGNTKVNGPGTGTSAFGGATKLTAFMATQAMMARVTRAARERAMGTTAGEPRWFSLIKLEKAATKKT